MAGLYDTLRQVFSQEEPYQEYVQDGANKKKMRPFLMSYDQYMQNYFPVTNNQEYIDNFIPNYNGNIDLHNVRPIRNPDGSVSTVQSMSFDDGSGETLIPTISQDGRRMTPDEAIQYYYQTGRHLGNYESPEVANAVGQLIHGYHQMRYGR